MFSGSHFNKVCRATIQNNCIFQVILSDIRLYTNESETPPKNYSIYTPNFKWTNKTKKQDDKIVSIGGKEDLKKPIEVMPEELIPPKAPQPPPPPKLKKTKKIISSTSPPPPKSSIIDNIISNKETKKKLEKSLKIIKSII